MPEPCCPVQGMDSRPDSAAYFRSRHEDRIFLYHVFMTLNINGEAIPDSLLEQEFSAIKAHYESLGNVSCCERDDEFRGYAKENVIARVLLAQEAERSIPNLSADELDKAIEQLKADHGGEAQFYVNIGMTPDQTDLIRQNVDTNIRLQKYIQTLSDGVPPSDEQLREYYLRNKDLFKTTEEVRVLHILKAPKRGEERKGAYELLRSLRERAMNHEDFLQLASEYSDKPKEEADLGFFKRGDILEEFELVAFSLRVGEVSPVFGSAFGFHLIKLMERKPSVLKPLAEVRDEVSRGYEEEQRAAAIQAKVAELRKHAAIEGE